MSILTIKTLEYVAYITILVLAMWTSWKKGEKEGSSYMLKYLRDHKFFDDTGYARFMAHIRAEKNNLEDEEENDS